jgi:hypothetical protein
LQRPAEKRGGEIVIDPERNAGGGAPVQAGEDKRADRGQATQALRKRSRFSYMRGGQREGRVPGSIPLQEIRRGEKIHEHGTGECLEGQSQEIEIGFPTGQED